MSDSSTWNSTTSYVGTNLYATTYAWTIDWRTTFENQRDTLKSRLAANSISNSSYLVGQSAGGVTARMVGGGQTLQGIMTVGTPNSGAPIKDDAADAAEYALYTLDDGYNVADTFIDFEDTEDDTALWDTIAGAISYGIGYIGAASDEIENYIGQFYPVFDEIGSSSTFMEYTLPGEGESSNVATRIGMTFVADDYYDGAAWQLLQPTEAAEITDDVNEGGALALALGDYMLDLPTYDGEDIEVAHMYEADALYVLGDDLTGWDQMWCAAVSGGGEYCLANDLVVPEWSQEYYGATYYLPYTGVTHPYETGQSATISSALHTYFGITSR
jgi:hypothetical protein